MAACPRPKQICAFCAFSRLNNSCGSRISWLKIPVLFCGLSSPLHRLDFSGLPGLVKPWLKRAVDAKDRVPAFAGNGLQPVDWESEDGRVKGVASRDSNHEKHEPHELGWRVNTLSYTLTHGLLPLLAGIQLRSRAGIRHRMGRRRATESAPYL